MDFRVLMDIIRLFILKVFTILLSLMFLMSIKLLMYMTLLMVISMFLITKVRGKVLIKFIVLLLNHILITKDIGLDLKVMKLFILRLVL